MLPVKEGMSTGASKKHEYKEGLEVYDGFYSEIYDHLLLSGFKNNFEVGTIINETSPTDVSIIADIGCGTGHHVNELQKHNLKVTGVDISQSMVNMAKQNYPDCDYQVGDAMDPHLFKMSSLTHILCLYFTIYFFEDKTRFFTNCMDWLMPGGYLIVHLVDREDFDPILPPGNPLQIVSAQKYAKERITSTKVTFNDFIYHSNFDLDTTSDTATFNEKFKFNDGRVRKQQHKMRMEDSATIVNMAQNCGFILQGKVNMVKCSYDSQYLYIFVKPS
jgi:SAM-dependent methyltransferase